VAPVINNASDDGKRRWSMINSPATPWRWRMIRSTTLPGFPGSVAPDPSRRAAPARVPGPAVPHGLFTARVRPSMAPEPADSPLGRSGLALSHPARPDPPP